MAHVAHALAESSVFDEQGDRLLAELSTSLSGAAIPVPDEKWKELGFQSADCRTDFRAGGKLALRVVLHLAKTENAWYLAHLRQARGVPISALFIGCTALVLRLMGDQRIVAPSPIHPPVHRSAKLLTALIDRASQAAEADEHKSEKDVEHGLHIARPAAASDGLPHAALVASIADLVRAVSSHVLATWRANTQWNLLQFGRCWEQACRRIEIWLTRGALSGALTDPQIGLAEQANCQLSLWERALVALVRWFDAIFAPRRGVRRAELDGGL